MTTITDPDPEKVLAASSCTSGPPDPSHPTLSSSRTLASDPRSTPSLQAIALPTTTATELEQASFSSTPATRASSVRDHQTNDGDDEQEESPCKQEDNDDVRDMYEDDVILPVELTVVPDHILESIPDEIWCLLLSFVPPAKLITLTRVCRRWKLMIERDLVANFWKPLTIQAELLDHALSLDLNVDSENAEMPIGFIKTFLELVLGHTLVICELCLTRSKRGCGSAIPLPVNRHDTLGRVWMCRPCRREYYETRPEPKRPFKTEDRVSLYGLPGYPAKVSRSTGPPAPRRRYYPRRHWSEFGSSRYYDDYDAFDSTDDEFGDYGSDDFGGYGSDDSGGCFMATEADFEEDDSGDSGEFGDYGSDYIGSCYFATEADLEEDDRWTKEADAREAAAREAARIPVGVMKDASSAVIRDTPGDTYNLGQGVQDFADIERSQVVCQGNETVGAANVKHDKPASIVESEVDDTVVTEGSAIDQSNNDAGGTSLGGVPEIRLAADSDEVEGGQAELEGEADDITMDEESVNANAEPVDEQQMDEVNDEEEDGEMDEAEEDLDEEEEEEEDMDEENEEEDEDEEEANGHANQAIIQEARRHHGGDIGIQTHSRNNTQLRSKLLPLRYRLMETRLGLLGLHLRNDSKLSQDYLNGLMDDPFKIADVMKQMQWYFEATDYPSYIKDNDSSTAKSAAMEQWIEDLISAHGENAKTAYRGLDAEENPEDAVVNVMDVDQPPKSLWPVLDMWIDHRLKVDQNWSPTAETFAVRVATDDLQD